MRCCIESSEQASVSEERKLLSILYKVLSGSICQQLPLMSNWMYNISTHAEEHVLLSYQAFCAVATLLSGSIMTYFQKATL